MNPQEAIVPEALNPKPETRNPNHNITIIAMALFVLLALSVVAFLYYQNQQLKNMLADYQRPIATPIPTATPDPTTSWKTYSKKGLDVTFKYPQQLIIAEDNLDITKKGGEVVMQISPNEISNYKFLMFIFSIVKSNQTVEKYIQDKANLTPAPVKRDTLSSIQWLGANKNVPTHYSSFSKDGYIYTIGLITVNEIAYDPENMEVLDQILSTFKFTETSPAPSAKACTMEAKLCPDGTSVGRSGPNCEFAPCPTSTPY